MRKKIRGGYNRYAPVVRVGPSLSPLKPYARPAAGVGASLATGYLGLRKRFPVQTGIMERYARRKLGEGVSGLVDTFKDRIKMVSGNGLTQLIPLMRGQISASGTGDITETVFDSVQTGSLSQNVKDSLVMSNTLLYKINQGGRLSSSNNTQAVTSLYDGTSGNIQPTASSGSSFNGILYGNTVPSSESNLNWGNLYSFYRGFPLTQSASTGYFYLDTYSSELTLTNSDSGAAIVDVYELLAKRDVWGAPFSNSDPYNAWASGLINYDVGDEVAGYAGFTKISPATVSCLPTSSQLFNTYWEVASHVRINMSGSAVHIHKSRYVYEDLIPVAHAYRSSVVGKISRNILIVARGNSLVTGGNNVVDKPAIVTWSYNAKISGKYLSPNKTYTLETQADSHI